MKEGKSSVDLHGDRDSGIFNRPEGELLMHINEDSLMYQLLGDELSHAALVCLNSRSIDHAYSAVEFLQQFYGEKITPDYIAPFKNDIFACALDILLCFPDFTQEAIGKDAYRALRSALQG